jgi:hypothetical protein
MLDTSSWILDPGFLLSLPSRPEGDILSWFANVKISSFSRNDNSEHQFAKYKALDVVSLLRGRFFPVSRDQYPVSGFFLFLIFSILFAGFITTAYGFEHNLEGQLSGWTIESEINDSWENSSGLRYIPELNISHELDNETILDSEISVNSYAASGSGPYMDDADIDLYRADIRYGTTRTETRVGLQKINFGPAVLLRSLKWFDRLDPTDPLQLTDGVYALRFRYDTLNNSNYWIWMLYGNDDPKDYEYMPSTSDDMEVGGRIQYPFLSGDLAFTFHSRKVNGSMLNIPEFRENRYALDGRWDVGIGLWFEGLIQEQNTDFIPYKWTKRISLGTDYTFNIGSGLYFLLEHMSRAMSEKMMKWNQDYNVSAFQMSYSLGILDSISAIGYYSWERDKYFQHLSWTRTYDNLIINVSFHYYPETAFNNTGLTQGTMTGGRGIQVMVIFNH